MKNLLMALFVFSGIFAYAACGSTVCDTQAATECGATFNTCLQGCLDDEACKEDCKTDYCKCLDDTNCADTTGDCN